MTEKRFTTSDTDILCMTIIDNENGKHYGFAKDIAIVMNDLNDENKQLKQAISDWKGSYDELYENCVKLEKENEILWNEVHILMEQGAEPSNTFKKYLESISTKYTKFWQRKLEKAKKDGVIE